MGSAYAWEADILLPSYYPWQDDLTLVNASLPAIVRQKSWKTRLELNPLY